MYLSIMPLYMYMSVYSFLRVQNGSVVGNIHRKCPDYRGVLISVCPDYRGVLISMCPDYRGVLISECPDYRGVVCSDYRGVLISVCQEATVLLFLIHCCLYYYC